MVVPVEVGVKPRRLPLPARSFAHQACLQQSVQAVVHRGARGARIGAVDAFQDLFRRGMQPAPGKKFKDGKALSGHAEPASAKGLRDLFRQLRHNLNLDIVYPLAVCQLPSDFRATLPILVNASKTPARVARTRMKSGERRAAIVESAVELFAEKGFRGTTTRELAAALHVTEPVLYQHFKTKKDLYSAIIEAEACAAEDSAGAFLELLDTDDDTAFFTALGHLVLERFQHDERLMRLLLFSALERHELSDMFFDRVVADFLKKVAGYIRRRIRAGAFRAVNPDDAARSIIGVFHYHGLTAMLHPGKVTRSKPKKLIDEIVQLFLGGIQSPSRR